MGILGETGAVAECGTKVRVFLDAGAVWLICTLDATHDGRHYDDAFLTAWKDIEKNPE